MPQSYVRGAFWSLTACFVSVLNDTLCKKSGMQLSAIHVLFFRFLFSTLTLVPFFIAHPRFFMTKNIGVHAIRGGLFALAMVPWCCGLIQLPLPLVTMIGFTTPLFVTFFARIFLKEPVGWQRILATTVGFMGIITSIGFSLQGATNMVGLALLATSLFATLDIMNKRLLVLNEGMGPMMFFSALWTTVFISPFALWQWPVLSLDLLYPLFFLGIGANLFLWCLLKASASCDLSALQPLRYSEFIFSCLMSVIVFQQWPTQEVLMGIVLIIPATLYLSHHEIKLERKKALKQ